MSAPVRRIEVPGLVEPVLVFNYAKPHGVDPAHVAEWIQRGLIRGGRYGRWWYVEAGAPLPPPEARAKPQGVRGLPWPTSDRPGRWFPVALGASGLVLLASLGLGIAGRLGQGEVFLGALAVFFGAVAASALQTGRAPRSWATVEWMRREFWTETVSYVVLTLFVLGAFVRALLMPG